jgi:hypothetical protein
VATIDPLGAVQTQRRLFVSGQGAYLVLADYHPDDATPAPSDASCGLAFGVKLPASVAQNPAVAGNTYRVQFLSIAFGRGGTVGVQRYPRVTLTINAETGADNVSRTGTVSWRLMSNEDENTVEGETALLTSTPEDDTVATFAWTGAPGGATITRVEGGWSHVYEGFMSADGQVGVFRGHINDFPGGGDDGSLGMSILIRQ